MIFPSQAQQKGPRGETLPEAHEGLPDSAHPAGLCPRCGKQSSFELSEAIPCSWDHSTYIAERNGAHQAIHLDQVRVLVCRHCRQGTIVVEEQWIGAAPARERRGGGTTSYRGIHWWPLPGAQLAKDVPEEIAQAFAEAVAALAAGCPRAAAVMARRTLEAVADEKGVAGMNLQQRLAALVARGVVQGSFAEWTTEVRLIGNAGAHFDPLQQVSAEDTQQLIAFVRELLRHVYELPAELARRRAGR